MLSIVDGSSSRRELLAAGSLALGGLSLATLLKARRAVAASGGRSADRSVIFLFLHGGPSQIETFDPKMDAPAGTRSVTGELPTTIPGVTFAGTFPRLARLAHRVSVVRSFTTGDGNHDIKPIVGRATAHANLGSLYSRVVGSNDPSSGLPSNVLLFPRAVDTSAQPGVTAFGRFDASGSLGSAFAPFVPGSGGALQSDMTLALPRDRFEDRRRLLRGLDRLRRGLESTAGNLDRVREQAYDTVLGGATEAFDLSKEDPRTIERYDTSGLIPADRISTSWKNRNNYIDHVRSLGKLLLLSRRLCEAGCGFVTVTTNFVWDMHADVNNAPMDVGMQYCGHPLDHALSAFLEDVADRGLSDRILLVVCGEMGRTPRINAKGGRDHWGGLAPLLLAGGGLGMGRVIGQSTPDAAEPATQPITIDHLVATVLDRLLDLGALRTATGLPPDLARIIERADPIPGLD